MGKHTTHGNALRQDQHLKQIGIDLDAEFEAIAQELPVYSDHQRLWRETTHQAFAVCSDMGLQPSPTPKMIRRDRCVGCGRCVLGCTHGAKWDSRDYLHQAVQKGAELVTGCVL